MNERSFRFVLGVLLWGVLIYSAYFETLIPVYTLATYLLFESITNWRLTLLISSLRAGSSIEHHSADHSGHSWLYHIDSERILRLVIAFFILLPVFVLPELLWFLPWFTAAMLIMAGITNICPMGMFLKWSGMR